MGFFDKIFGRSSSMTDARVERIINAYGRHMERWNGVADERDLPYSKAEIKEAIRRMIQMQDDPAIHDMLRAAYIGLADYLPLTPSERLLVKRHDNVSARGFDSGSVSPDQIAKLSDHFSEWTKLTERVADDAEKLAVEIGVIRRNPDGA